MRAAHDAADREHRTARREHAEPWRHHHVHLHHQVQARSAARRGPPIMKAFFHGCALREKLLLTGFLLLAAAIWLSSEVRRGTARWREWRSTARGLQNQ